MNENEKYVITGVNKLTGRREEMSRPMSYDEAKARLEREQESRRHIKYQPHIRLRVEKCLPVQLTFNFKDEV